MFSPVRRRAHVATAPHQPIFRRLSTGHSHDRHACPAAAEALHRDGTALDARSHFEFSVRPPIWVHFVVTFPLIALMCMAVLRPFKGWMVSEQYIHKAAPPEFESLGSHGEGYGWRGQAERAKRRAAKAE